MSSETASNPAATLDPFRFRRACAQFATGVAVVTILDGQGIPHGMTVNSFTSVSLNPPLILACIDSKAGIFPLFQVGAPMAINILREEQREISVLFARPGASRMQLTDSHPGTTGAPLLAGVLATFEGLICRTVEAGDHVIAIAEVVAVHADNGRPLLYFDSNYHRLS